MSTKSKRGDSVEDAEGQRQFSGHFDVLKLNEHLRLCMKQGLNSNQDTVDSDNNEADTTVEVILDEYIQIFYQLYKFFCMLGTVFGFVASDVKVKVEILQRYRSGPNNEKYESVGGMLLFEKESGYIVSNRTENASRTFLRLHRALLFVSQFLNKTLSLADEEGTSQIARETYSEALAKYHPWLIQKGAMMAMYALPSKKELFRQIAGDRHFEPTEVKQMLTEAIQVTQQIYDQCEKLFAEQQFLNLP